MAGNLLYEANVICFLGLDSGGMMDKVKDMLASC